MGLVSPILRVAARLVLMSGLFAAFSASGVALGENQRQQCDAVRNLAEIRYDPSLIISLVSDKRTNTCVFYVSLPPSGTSGDPAANAGAAIYAFLRSADPKMDLPSTIVPQLIEALSVPLGDERFQVADAKTLQEIIRFKAAKAIENCALSGLQKAPIAREDPIFTCGRTADTRFVLQASYGSVTVALFVPV